MYKVSFPNGVFIEVPTLEDAIKVATSIAGQSALPKDEPKQGNLMGKLGIFYARLDDEKQRQFLKLLTNSADGISDDTLRQSLSMSDNKKIGGMMSGLSKRAVGLSLKIEDIIFKEVKLINGKRSYIYKITPHMQSVIRKAETDDLEVISPSLLDSAQRG